MICLMVWQTVSLYFVCPESKIMGGALIIREEKFQGNIRLKPWHSYCCGLLARFILKNQVGNSSIMI